MPLGLLFCEGFFTVQQGVAAYDDMRLAMPPNMIALSPPPGESAAF